MPYTVGFQQCAHIVPKHPNHFVENDILRYFCVRIGRYPHDSPTAARPGEEACHLANQAKLVFSNLKDRSHGSPWSLNGA